jgi:DNA-binding GntR family transcriptional regulator
MATCVANAEQADGLYEPDGLYEQMKQRIIEGRDRPGTFLSESALARFHGTSRTPVREALSRLWEAGYIERMPGHGYLTARITFAQVRDTLEIRRLLETEAIARVAELDSKEKHEQLRSLATALDSTPGSRYPTATDNDAFHLGIVRATNNALWTEMLSRCLFRIDRFFALLPDLKKFQDTSVAEHTIILAALMRGDSDGAQAIMQRHLNRTASALLKALECANIESVMD